MEELHFGEQFNRTTVWYHGTTSTQVASLKNGINVNHSQRNCDFGIGFYVTSKQSQAIKWAKRKTKDEHPFNPEVQPVVLSYQFKGEVEFQPKIFEINSDYFEFVYHNRLNHKTRLENFQAVFGPVLDGQIIHLKQTVDDFFKQLISLEDMADKLLGKYKDDNQLCICSQSLADTLVLLKEEKYDFNN